MKCNFDSENSLFLKLGIVCCCIIYEPKCKQNNLCASDYSQYTIFASAIDCEFVSFATSRSF